MNHLHAPRSTILIPLFTSVLAFTSNTTIAQTKIQGVIDGRSGPTMSLKTVDSPPTLALLALLIRNARILDPRLSSRTTRHPQKTKMPGETPGTPRSQANQLTS